MAAVENRVPAISLTETKAQDAQPGAHDVSQPEAVSAISVRSQPARGSKRKVSYRSDRSESDSEEESLEYDSESEVEDAEESEGEDDDDEGVPEEGQFYLLEITEHKNRPKVNRLPALLLPSRPRVLALPPSQPLSIAAVLAKFYLYLLIFC